MNLNEHHLMDNNLLQHRNWDLNDSLVRLISFSPTSPHLGAFSPEDEVMFNEPRPSLGHVETPITRSFIDRAFLFEFSRLSIKRCSRWLKLIFMFQLQIVAFVEWTI